MSNEAKPVRVLYSFPHKLGAARICYTAWQQVNGLAAAGADIQVHPGVLHRSVPPGVRVQPTLGRGRFRLPYRVLGRIRSLALHDYVVARRLEKIAGQVDLVHVWPLAARETLKAATRLGIPAVLERPNAHTRFAYEAVRDECERLQVVLPPGHEHVYDSAILDKEEEEYQLAHRLLCPSEFVVQTFVNQGFERQKLERHQYGYDENIYFPDRNSRRSKFTALFVGVCAVRKGLHFALEAWLDSPAHRDGTFLIAGEFLGNYADRLSSMLSHPSIRVLGHQSDVPGLMRDSDILLLPSIEEGFGLVCTDAIGSGCVPVVSDACTELCRHMENALVHRVGDIKTLSEHITTLHQNRDLLGQLRAECLRVAPSMTWDTAGRKLHDVYRKVIAEWGKAELPLEFPRQFIGKHG